MKKIYCLLLVPVFMLPSCGAKKISDEKALEIINAVHDKYMTLQDTAEAYEATLHLKQEMYEKEIGKTSKNEVKYHIWGNKDGSIKVEAKGTESGEKAEYYIIQIPSQKYEQITYVKVYEPGAKEYVESVYVRADNSRYDSQIESFETIYAVPTTITNSVADPWNMKEIIVKDPQYSISDSLEINYYSTGDKNLTVKTIYKSSMTLNGSELREIDYSFNIVYDNLVFSSLKASQKQNDGTNIDVDATFSVKNKPFKIVVPENYEKLIVRDV